ncbi:hypothetical protein [Azotobacter salinestris]|uniref:hypothetical protein n=1 Tax=Azotobacter salinestris TaxID=69964 RepID=UPI0032DF0E78
MLNRYPDQAATRKGFVLTGVLFCLFGLLMAVIGSTLGAVLGLLFGAILLVPALCVGHAGFARYEKLLSWIAIFGNLS